MRIALLGYGRMGREVAARAESAGHEVIARLGRAELTEASTSIADRLRSAEVAIDFSAGEVVPRTVRAAATAKVDLVVGTTGWRAEEVDLAVIEAAGRGVVHGANFSPGVHLLLRIVREAARLADAVGGYDLHVEEAHHRHKRDSPSGTAIRVAEEILAASTLKSRWLAGPPEGLPDPRTLYVSSIRAGEIPGTHVVGIEGIVDRLEVRHEARSRAGFAEGAVRAAEWIRGRRGVFPFAAVMEDLWTRGTSRGEDGA